jgi:hypothetical protein
MLCNLKMGHPFTHWLTRKALILSSLRASHSFHFKRFPRRTQVGPKIAKATRRQFKISRGLSASGVVRKTAGLAFYWGPGPAAYFFEEEHPTTNIQRRTSNGLGVGC